MSEPSADPGREHRLKVAVVDDEPVARASLRKLLGEDPEVELVAECADGEEAARVLRGKPADIVFLDVQMPGKDGFAVLEELEPADLPVVVFATAYDRYALRAFDVHAVDYLLKPFDDERFRRALERAKEHARRGGAPADVRALLTDVRRPAAAVEPARRLAIHREGRVDLVDVDDILWVEAADQYVRLHTTGGEHLMRESMASLERQLDPARFLRVHRSAIVALDRVRSVRSSGTGGGRALVGERTWLPVSRTRMAALRARLA